MPAYARWLPLINYENRQCGLQACKVLMKEGGVIASDAVRHPLQPLHPITRAGLIEIARQLDPVVLREITEACNKLGLEYRLVPALSDLLEQAIEDGPSSKLPIGRVLAEAEQAIDIHWSA